RLAGGSHGQGAGAGGGIRHVRGGLRCRDIRPRLDRARAAGVAGRSTEPGGGLGRVVSDQLAGRGTAARDGLRNPQRHQRRGRPCVEHPGRGVVDFCQSERDVHGRRPALPGGVDGAFASNSYVSRPIVAIIGRPNVGKSTLFNRVIGQRKAIVDAEAGLTRDRLYGVAEWRGREFAVVDTAGLDLETANDPSRTAIEAQTKIAIDQARVVGELPPAEERPAGQDAPDRLAIMGRPNVGKSSLLNALLGDERALVSPTPGTTRDPVDTELSFDGVPVVLIDTAGIRKKSSSRDRLERYSLLRGINAMERADTVLLVIDASSGVVAQDQHVAGYALEAGKRS